MPDNQLATTSRPRYELAATKAKDAFIKVSDEKTFLREIMFTLQILRGNELLQKADPASIENAVVNLALTGATLNPALQQAYLVPRGGKCCLDISYRGMCRILTDAGTVVDIDATVVHEKDDFAYAMGLNPFINHVPSLEDDPGKPMWVYAIGVFATGYKKFIVLNRKEIEKVKATSKARSGPWIDWEEEMWRKTAIKKLYKLLPQTERMSQAVAVVNAVEGLDMDGVRKESAQAVLARFKAGDTTPPGEKATIISSEEEIPEFEAEPGENLFPKD